MTTTTDDGGMYGQLPTCFGSTPSPQTQAENCCDSCPSFGECIPAPTRTWQGFLPGKRGDWMQTATGGQMHPLDPRPEEIHIADIAHALSQLCRFSGHCLRFYSVAEHCVLMAREAPDEYKLTTLMHDASEAYLADVIRPIKPFLTNYHDIEARLETVIAERFNYPWPMPAEVKRLDNAILADEMAQNMAPPPVDWRLPELPLGVRLQFWAPEKAEFEFRAAFTQYGGHFC